MYMAIALYDLVDGNVGYLIRRGRDLGRFDEGFKTMLRGCHLTLTAEISLMKSASEMDRL
ncbi:hypothetical protein H9L39_00024 [Fusarium oxysporum f. sp. albedinis]|nr:hypothetical protein H9L39_00024 [Fusarium oxysporum f. sp. albedinis]